MAHTWTYSSSTSTAANITVVNDTDTYSDTAWTGWVNSQPLIAGDCITVTTTSNATVAASDIIWNEWTNIGTINTDTNGGTITWQGWSKSVAESKEQCEKRRKAEIIRLRERRKALVAAQKLLKHVLSDDEFEEYRRYNCVRVRGKKHIYEVGVGNIIYVLDFKGEPLRKLCCHASRSYPAQDRLLAAVLTARADEELILVKGNDNSFLSHEKDQVRARRAHRSAA